MPKWFDDWQITLGRPRGSASHFFIVVRLPHAEQPEIVFSTSDNVQATQLSNLLDKAFSELTGSTGPKKQIMGSEVDEHGPDTIIPA